MRSVGNFFYTLALALWVGGGALYTFVLTPAIFAAAPSTPQQSNCHANS